MSGSRERIMGAMLDLVSSEGFEAISLDDVVERAGTSREEFERQFESMEDCAMVVFDRFLEDHNRVVRKAYESEEVWPDSLRAAAYAVASWMTENPQAARFGTVGMLWSSELAQARREAGFQNFVDLVDAGKEVAEDPDSIPPFTAEGVIGSIAEMLTRRLSQGEVHLYELVPQLMSIAVRPYLGEEAAAKELTIPPPPRPPAAS
jgi:AcrR family transcriptional regulator